MQFVVPKCANKFNSGYLWEAKSLYFWWRDLGVAQKASRLSQSACFLNVQDPLLVSEGNGPDDIYRKLPPVLRDAFGDTVPAGFIDCLAAPPKEPVFPQDLAV